MTINWSSYLPEVLPEVKDCPDEIAENAIRSAVIDFCKKTRIWRVAFGPLSLTANVSEVALGQPANTEVITIVQAAVLSNGEWSDIGGPYSEEMMDAEVANWREKTTDTLPTRFLNGINKIRVYPTPTTNQSNVLKGQMAIQPTRAALGAEDFLYNDWLDEIASGAKAKLMAMSNVPWKDLVGAEMHAVKFRNGYGRARAKVFKGGRGSVTAFYQPFR